MIQAISSLYSSCRAAVQPESRSTWRQTADKIKGFLFSPAGAIAWFGIPASIGIACLLDAQIGLLAATGSFGTSFAIAACSSRRSEQEERGAARLNRISEINPPHEGMPSFEVSIGSFVSDSPGPVGDEFPDNLQDRNYPSSENFP